MKRDSIGPGEAAWVRRYGLIDIPPERMRLNRYARGEALCREGETIPELLLITRGKVRVSVTGANGRSLLYCINVGHGILGSIELLTGAPATASGLALTDAAAIAVPIRENLPRLTGSLAFMNALGRELSVVFDHSSRLSALNILYPLRTRVCSYIAMTQEGGLFSEKLTDVNALLGTSYRHLLRTLKALCEEGILIRAKGGYAIRNQAALEALAEGYYAADTRPR